MKRVSYDLFAALLETLRDGQEHSITRAQYEANMGAMQVVSYKNHLVEKGLIEERTDGRNRYLRITPSGIKWLRTFIGLKEELYGKSGTRKN